MKTFTLAALHHIRDFQFLTDSSGLALDEDGQLYQFVGDKTTLVATPASFRISHLHFLTPEYGAVVGNAVDGQPTPAQGSLGSWGSLLTLGLLLLALRRKRPRRSLALGLASLAGAGIFSCSTAWQAYRQADPDSPVTTFITRTRLAPGNYHYYLPNKNQTAFIAITHNHGLVWETHQIPTNFYTTALTAIGQNFLVGTHANAEEGPLALHGDGDIWLYGTDTTFTKALAHNMPQHPYRLSVSRGINGFAYSADTSQLLVFGTDRMPTLPANELSATAGNIYALPASLQPPAKLVEVPDTVAVHSLAQAGTGELWATLENRKPRVAHGRLFYVPLPTKALLRLRYGRWQAVPAAGFSSFEQVVFLPGTHMGYLLTATGEVLVTQNDGDIWQRRDLGGIRRLRPFGSALALLRQDNQLLLD
ncbi:MAG: hypothetical protein ACRYF0_04605 [Janthinobacterium lividum]